MKKMEWTVLTAVMTLVMLAGQQAGATPQVPERIRHKGRMSAMRTEPTGAISHLRAYDLPKGR